MTLIGLREVRLNLTHDTYAAIQELARMAGATPVGYLERVITDCAKHYQQKVDEAVLKAIKEQKNES